MKNKISNFFKFLLKDKKKMTIVLLLLVIFPSFAFAGVGSYLVDSVAEGALSVLSLLVGMAQWVGVQILQMAAYLFDNFLLVTLSNNLYDSEWIRVGWSVFRDLANIGFILGIIIIGIFMIIGKQEGNDGWERMLLNLIIAALAMNFSMFIGRIVIDMGNFTASVFYRISTIEVTTNKKGSNQDNTQSFKLAEMLLGLPEGAEPYYGKRAYATSLVSYINPYYMKDASIMKVALTNQYNSNNNTKFVNEKDKKIEIDKSKEGGNLLKWLLLFNGFLTAWIFFVISKTFFVTALTFIARAGHLIYALIKAPVYFAWSFLPGGENAFKSWFSDIATKSFCITVFTAGLWILMMFISSIQNQLFSTDVETVANDLLMTYLLVIGKAVLIITVVRILGQKTSELCEGGKDGAVPFGEKIWNFGVGAMGKVAGVGGAMALGGFGLAARGARRGSRFYSDNKKPEYKRGEWSMNHKNPLLGEQGWAMKPAQDNQAIEAVLSESSIKKLSKAENEKQQQQQSNKSFDLKDIKVDKQKQEQITKPHNLDDINIDKWKQKQDQKVWEESKGAIPLAAHKTQPISEISKNILKGSEISPVVASAISTPAQPNISNSMMKSMINGASDKKDTLSASELVKEKQNSEVVINAQGATIHGKNLNVRSDKENIKTEQTAEGAVQDARTMSAVNSAKGVPEDNSDKKEKSGNSNPKWKVLKSMSERKKEEEEKERQRREKWEKENEGKGVWKAIKKIGKEKTVNAWNNKGNIALKGVGNLVKGVIGGTAVVGAKAAEKAWIQLDRHGTSEHAKVGDERRKKRAEEYKDWGKRQEEAAKRLSSAEDKLETARVELDTAETEKQKKIALNKKKLADKELKAAEKATKKAATKSGKAFADEVKDAFTTELWRNSKIRSKVSGQHSTLKDINRTMEKVNKQSEKVLKELEDQEKNKKTK